MNTLSVGSAIQSAWKLFWSRPWIFIQAGIILFLINTAINLVQAIIEKGGEYAGAAVSNWAILLSSLIGFVTTVFITMGETHFFLRAQENVPTVKLRDLWHPHPFWNYLGAMLLAGLITVVGFVLLVVPGIIALILFIFVGYVVVEEKLSPVDAIKRSIALTKGNRWKILLLVFALLGINILGMLALLVGLMISVPVSFLTMIQVYRTLKAQSIGESIVEPSEPVAVA